MLDIGGIARSHSDSSLSTPSIATSCGTLTPHRRQASTAIGADCELRDAEIEHSVVFERSRIIGVHHIHDSLLGREVEVVRSGDRPKATRLMLGDHSRADLE